MMQSATTAHNPCNPPLDNRFGRSPTFQFVDGCKCIDLVIDHGRISTKDQITHHILMRLGIRGGSLGSDDILSCNKGGWWVDSLSPTPYGSRLWTLHGKNFDDQNVLSARRMVKNALKDMIDLNIINDISLIIEQNRSSGLLDIKELIVTKPDGQIFNVSFLWLWDDI